MDAWEWYTTDPGPRAAVRSLDGVEKGADADVARVGVGCMDVDVIVVFPV